MLYIIFALTGIFGGAIQTVTGFGAGIALMQILLLKYDMIISPALTTVGCFSLSLAVAISYRKYIQPKKVIYQAFLFTLFAIISLKMQRMINVSLLYISFSILLIILSVYFLCFEKKARVKDNLFTATFFSAFSGILSGLYAVGGPTMALYYISTCEKKENYVANIQFVFIFANTLTTVARIKSKILTADLIPISILLVASIIVGMFVGMKVTKKVNIEKMKKIVYIMVGVVGVVNLMTMA